MFGITLQLFALLLLLGTKLYIDSVERGVGIDANNNAKPLRIGGDYAGANVAGYVDELRVSTITLYHSIHAPTENVQGDATTNSSFTLTERKVKPMLKTGLVASPSLQTKFSIMMQS